jgi:hypothetical protein
MKIRKRFISNRVIKGEENVLRVGEIRFKQPLYYVKLIELLKIVLS